MKLDDFDLLALGFFVPRMAEGAQSLHTFLRDYAWAHRPPKFIRAWLAKAEEKGCLALVDSGTGSGTKYALTYKGFVLYNNHIAAKQRQQSRQSA